METYLNKWFTVLQGMSNDNTYKLAWGRAIIELVQLEKYEISENNIVIEFTDIAHMMLKYYWNQSFFFNLVQSANHSKPPVIYQIVNKLIAYYKEYSKSTIPIWFNKAEDFFSKHKIVYDKSISKIVSVLKQDVCWRFNYAHQIDYKLYQLNEQKNKVYIFIEDLKVIQDYGKFLTPIIIYKWSQLLEQFNRSPRIVSKVKGSQENKIKRSNLQRYKELLLLQYQNNDIKDFYTDQVISLDDISIDHVIPWSFMYSDDLWNLVITTKSYNSSKSNHVPTLEQINKLKNRNLELVNLLNDEKSTNALMESIRNDYLTKYYYDLII